MYFYQLGLGLIDYAIQTQILTYLKSSAMSDTIFKVLGEVIAYGGGAAAVAYILFQYLGKKWIENKFAERLDQLKHQHALELPTTSSRNRLDA